MHTRRYYDKHTGEWREEVILTRKEQAVWYRDCCKMILNHTRWVLDNLDYLMEFHVDWEDYHRKHYSRDYKRAKKECKKDSK